VESIAIELVAMKTILHGKEPDVACLPIHETQTGVGAEPIIVLVVLNQPVYQIPFNAMGFIEDFVLPGLLIEPDQSRARANPKNTIHEFILMDV
jgi:hypothetical protein